MIIFYLIFTFLFQEKCFFCYFYVSVYFIELLRQWQSDTLGTDSAEARSYCIVLGVGYRAGPENFIPDLEL